MTNLHACAGLFASLQKILKELWKYVHASLPHVSLKYKLSGTINIIMVCYLFYGEYHTIQVEKHTSCSAELSAFPISNFNSDISICNC